MKDKREVNMLSTFHSDSMIDKRRSRTVSGGIETIRKPHMVEDYNQGWTCPTNMSSTMDMHTGTKSGGREYSSTFLTCALLTLMM